MSETYRSSKGHHTRWANAFGLSYAVILPNLSSLLHPPPDAADGGIGHWRKAGGVLAKQRTAEVHEVAKVLGTTGHYIMDVVVYDKDTSVGRFLRGPRRLSDEKVRQHQSVREAAGRTANPGEA